MQVEVWNSNSQMTRAISCDHLVRLDVLQILNIFPLWSILIHPCHISHIKLQTSSHYNPFLPYHRTNKLCFISWNFQIQSDHHLIYFSSIVIINLYIPPEKGTTSRPGLHFYRTATAAPAPRAARTPRSRQLRPRRGHCRRCGKCWRRCSTTWRRRSWSWDFSCHLGEIHGT